MALSEQEQRLLDEMERHLMQNDADVVSAPRGGRTISYRNIVYGTILVLVGIGALIGGVSSQLIWVGVIGFVLMLGGVILAATPLKSSGSSGPTPAGRTAPHGAGTSQASFMDRMNDRWDRRHGEGH